VTRAPSALAVFAAAVLLAVALCARASAEERRYALVIGYNGAPAGGGPDDTPPPSLRFADDDAMAFYELRRELGDEAIVLASPDADTRRRYPQSADAARPPTIAALDLAVARLGSAMQADARAGRTTVFSFFYSGHGARDGDGQAALTLLDGALSRRMLYERILDRAPADVVHLFVDACHAEEIVRLRDGDAKAVPLSPDDVAAYVSQATLARYPQVGIAVASSTNAVAHEWDLYQSGVFTHQVISALRGAADVNADGRVEYTELDAFLAAANREVQDPRARLRAVVRAPASSPRAPIADLTRARGTSSRLTKIPAAPEELYVEDTLGNRLADGRPERGFAMSFSLPVNRLLFVRRGDQEAEVVLRPGIDLEFAALSFRARPLRSRGALESALRAGLFLTPFGPSYYRGYVDRQDAVAVPFAPSLEIFGEPHSGVPPRGRASLVRSSLGGAAVALLASSAVFAGLAWGARQDNQSAVERASVDAANRFRLDTALTAGFLISGVACAAAAFFWGREP
jgi:hypothetical protein